MKSLRLFVSCVSATVLLLGLVGCANLAVVRDYAAEAQVLSAHPAVAADLVGTQVRRQALYGREESVEALALHQSYREKFEATQTVLVDYLGMLAAMADPAVVDFQKNVVAATSASQKAGLVDETEAKKLSSALQWVAKLATDGARRKILSETVVRCDEPVQALVGALAETITVDYLASLNAERQAAQSLLADVERGDNPGVLRLARFSLREHRLSIDARQRTAEAYVAALRKVAEGHRQLSQHIGDFTRKEWIAEFKAYQNELKELQAQLR